MAAEIIGGAFFSSLFQTLFDKLGSPLYRSLFQGLKVDDGLLKDLRITMLLAYQLLDDAEDKQIRYLAVREWLFELKEAIDDAEQLLDRINFEALRYKQESKPESSMSKRIKLSVSTYFKTFEFDKEIGEIRDRLDRLVLKKDVLGLKGIKDRPLQRLPAPLVDESRVYGRDGDKKHIIELLLSDDLSGDNISVVSIVGMGGLGKTTLAQLVYDDKKVTDHFELKAWVTVSDEFDIFKITKQIVGQVKRENENVSLNQKQLDLKEAMRGRKFLLVLDDVWNQSYDSWDVLQSPFGLAARGSKIIVTTRDDAIAKMMGAKTHYLELVSDDACWNLFVDHAFKGVSFDSHKDLLAIGKEIVKRCKGVPLAIKSLAGLLRTVPDLEEWERVLKSDIWELQSQILPSLWLSYHYLPVHLKRCFAYCSIFPKDYAFGESDRKKLTLLWMAEGLLQPRVKGERIEDVGGVYFKDLTSRSLFQQSSINKSTYFMHDLVHDLAAYVAGDFCFRFEAGKETSFSSKTRHFSYSELPDLEKFEGLSEAKNLRSCINYMRYSLSSSSVILPSLLQRVGRCLRAICLSGTQLTVLPESIGDLKHLRYLDLSDNDLEKLPDTLCGLYNLQTLLLSYCRRLSKLPTDMGNLVNLRHLDIKKVPLEEMPPEMGNMKDLQTLPKFVVGKNNCSDIRQLKGLSHIYGKLEISGLNNVDYDGDSLEAILEDKKRLKKIKLYWKDPFDGSDDLQKDEDRKVLDALKPHTNLKELLISAYSGTTFPDWVGHHSYVNMVCVTLINCGNCPSLPPLGQLSSLQFLRIEGCSGVVKIADELYGNSSKIEPFRSLEVLAFVGMLELQEWSFFAGQKGSCFPRLVNLSIEDCPKLERCFPDDFPRQMDKFFPSLELLSIDDCPRLTESFLSTNLPSNSRKLYICGSGSIYSCFEEASLKTLPEALHRTTLTFLTIVTRVPDLKAINGRGFQHLTSLEEFLIKDCHELQCLPGETLPTCLTSLCIKRVPKLKHLGTGFQHLTSLEEFLLEDCHELQCLQGETLPTCLTSLCIKRVPKLKHLGTGFQHLTSLKKLSISYVEDLRHLAGSQSFPVEWLPVSLTCLHITWVLNLKDLGKSFHHLVSLKELRIDFCYSLQFLPEEGLPLSLSFLRIVGCPLLAERCQRDTGEDWPKIAHIPEMEIF